MFNAREQFDKIFFSLFPLTACSWVTGTVTLEVTVVSNLCNTIYVFRLIVSTMIVSLQVGGVTTDSCQS